MATPRWAKVAIVALVVVHAGTAVAIAARLPDGAGWFGGTTAVGASACRAVQGATRQADCRASVLPPSYSAMSMGVPDYGTGAGGSGHAHGATIGVDTLTGPTVPPDEAYTIVAAWGSQDVGGSPRRVLTFNGTTPGPTLSLTQGDLVQVTLQNTDVADGVTIHWHGVDVPGGEDGVAGVTQDAVLPGEEFTYRFVVPDAGTYWYHTHQDSVRNVALGLFGAIVVAPRQVVVDPVPDLPAVIHTYGTTTTINAIAGQTGVELPAGTSARVRIINADNGPRLVTATGDFRVAALDGTDLDGGAPLTDTYVDVPAGGRVDLVVPVEVGGTRVGILGGPSLVLGPAGSAPPPLAARAGFDPLAYGTAGGSARAAAALGPITRRFTYRVGQRVGYLDGRRGYWYTINGRTIPHVPMFMVRTGDVVLFRVTNATSVVHPMHLHGHHALVVSRNGVPASGAPWWVDSLEVRPGQTYELELVADNPGIWMDHCHNLPHVRLGLMTHLMYEGVGTPFRIGHVRPGLVNTPE